jgi:hypothetical protein
MITTCKFAPDDLLPPANESNELGMNEILTVTPKKFEVRTHRHPAQQVQSITATGRFLERCGSNEPKAVSTFHACHQLEN